MNAGGVGSESEGGEARSEGGEVFLKIISYDKNELVVRLDEVDLGVVNLVTQKLLEEREIDFAASDYDHPISGNPVLRVQGKDVKKHLLNALKEAKEEISALEKALKHSHHHPQKR